VPYCLVILFISACMLFFGAGCAESQESTAEPRCLVDSECTGTSFCHPTRHICVLPENYVDAEVPSILDAAPPSPPQPDPDMQIQPNADGAILSPDSAMIGDADIADLSPPDRGVTDANTDDGVSQSDMQVGDAGQRPDASQSPMNDMGQRDAAITDATVVDPVPSDANVADVGQDPTPDM